MSYEEPPGTYTHIVDVGKLQSRLNSLRRTRTAMREPPKPPEFNPNHKTAQSWISLAEDIGIPDKAHELPILMEVALNMRDPMITDMFKKILMFAKLGDPAALRQHYEKDVNPRRERFLREDTKYQTALRTYTAEKSSRAKHEVEYTQQVHTSWNNLCRSLRAALERNDNNPARLQPNDAKFVGILKNRGYVDVRNHTVDVQFGTLSNLDSETIGEITWALLSSIRSHEAVDVK